MRDKYQAIFRDICMPIGFQWLLSLCNAADPGSGHNEESLGAQHPDKDTNESGSMPDDPKAIKGLAMKDITSKVADPLGKLLGEAIGQRKRPSRAGHKGHHAE